MQHYRHSTWDTSDRARGPKPKQNSCTLTSWRPLALRNLTYEFKLNATMTAFAVEYNVGHAHSLPPRVQRCLHSTCIWYTEYLGSHSSWIQNRGAQPKQNCVLPSSLPLVRRSSNRTQLYGITVHYTYSSSDTF